MPQVTAARSDRFLQSALGQIPDAQRPHALLRRLQRELDPKDWLQELLADINNQDAGGVGERLIDRKCVFEWVTKNMPNPNLVFYDEDRAEEFSDLEPSKPNADSQYEPFLSPKVLTDILLRCGMVRRVAAAGGGGTGAAAAAAPRQ